MYEKEIWKDIPHYEGRYLVSNQGRVFSLLRKKYMKLKQNQYGYLEVQLQGKTQKRKWEKVHRLVAMAFISNPSGLPQVNHKNEVRTDNRVENLEWCDSKYNSNYGTRNNNISKSMKNNVKISYPIEQIEDGNVIAIYPSLNEASRITKISAGNICSVCKGDRKSAGGFQWKYKMEE